MSKSPNDTPPPNKFEDYTLTIVRGPEAGLLPTPSGKAIQWPGYAGVGDGNAAAGTNNNDPQIVNLGFSFPFNGKLFNKICATEGGDAILLDPDSGVPNPSFPNTYSLSYLYQPAPRTSNILSTFGSNRKDVLLCLWRDQMSTSFDSVERLIAGSTQRSPVAQSTVDLLKKGLLVQTNNLSYDSSFYAVSYYNDYSSMGKMFVVRWNVTSGTSASNFTVSQMKFQLVLYENGTIEYRYTDRKINQGKFPYRPPYSPSGTEGAAMGIFVNWDGWNFRDLSVGLGYRDEERSEYVNGGYVYDSTYTDTGVNLNGDTGVVPYTCNLDPINHWPGTIDSGAVYVFSPPVLKRRSRRSITSLRDSRPFVRGEDESALFNDQKTQIFAGSDAPVKVQYPSMLPVSYRLNSNSSQPESVIRMYQSGSIEVSRSMPPGLFESPYSDSVIETSWKRGR